MTDRVRGSERRSGLRTELILQLGIVMAVAVLVLIATLSWSHERALQEVVGRALAAEARAGETTSARVDPGTDWWIVASDGVAAPRGAVSAPLDPRTHDLAATALDADGAVVDAGAPWDPIRFAMPIDASGRVAVARLPARFSLALRAKPLSVVALLVVMTLALFVAVGVALLETRVVGPLGRLAHAARELADGGTAVLVPIEGPAEAAALAQAFNEMSESLESRSKSLVAAVSELRAANAELQRTQAGLARAERLAVVGRLAAGVAHEVGNPLGAMLAFGELAARDPNMSDASRAHLAKAAAAGERARRILGQLLDYSRPARPTRSVFDLADVARECADLVSAQSSSRLLEITLEVEPGATQVWGDPSSAAQVVLNLMLNAAHACTGTPPARVSVRVHAVPMRRRAGESDGGAERARLDAVACSIADNGCGVRDEDRERIFDPFFTTKPPGEGTGLGLATALRLAHEMDGELELSEAPPPGFSTEFSFRLHAASAEDGDRVRVRERPTVG